MPGSQLAAVADRLAGSGEFVDARIASLRRGADDASLASAEKTGLQRRLAGVLIEAGRPAEAVGELRAAGAAGADSLLRDELFAALLHASEWADAAEMEPEPGPWLEVLERRRTPGAAGILAEIERRFGDALDEQELVRLERERGRVAVGGEDSQTR